jgi:ankyrin repeat protein
MSFADIKKAIKTDKLKAVKKLVEADPAIVNTENSDGDSPLYIAVQEENMDIAKYLIDNGADVNHINTREVWSILHLACHLKNLEMVKLLLDNDADIELTTNTGATPLYLICETGAHSEVTFDIIYDLLEAAEELGVEDEYINKKEEHGYFPLYIACKEGDNDIVELLLKRGANIEEKNEQGQTALMIAIQKNHEKSHLEVIKTLLKAGADLLYTDNTGHTALDWAQESNDDDVIRLLIQYAPSTSSSTSTSTSSRSSTSSNTSSRSKSKSFSVGSVAPTALDVVTIKQSKIPETAEDFINIEDVNIVDFLSESNKNKVIKVHNSFYALNGEDVKGHFLSKAEKNHYVYYPCKRALPPPALGVSKDDVHMDKPLFSASYLVGVLSDFVLLSEVMSMLDDETQYFEIMANSEVQHVPATASAQMFTSKRNAVSANHCQEGKEAKILKLKKINIVEEDAASAKAEGRKRHTRRNKGNKRTMKRSKHHKSKTINRRTKTRMSKRRQ